MKMMEWNSHGLRWLCGAQIALLAILLGCGQGGPAATIGGEGPPASTTDAPPNRLPAFNREGAPSLASSVDFVLPPPPQLKYYGGPVLANVQVVIVFWGPNVNSTVRSRIQSFYQTITAPGYTGWLSEYNTAGVTPVDGQPGSNQTIGSGSLVATTTITPVNHNSVILQHDIEVELDGQIQNHNLVAPNANTIYMVYLPPGVGVPDYCTKYCAYHVHFQSSSGANVVYAMIPDYGPGNDCDDNCGNGTLFDNIGTSSSHELVEAITDSLGGGGDPARPAAWKYGQAEIGDLCARSEVCVGGFVMQQEYSNSRNGCFAPQLPGARSAGADAIVVNTGQGIVVRRSTGSYFSCNEAFTPEPFYGDVGTYFADVTGDGRADAIVVNSGQGIVVRRSNGDGFGAYENWTTQPYYGNVGTYFADVDGDRYADAIVVNSGQGIVVRRSNQVNGFGAYENWTTQAFVGNVGNYFADVDGDGYADAIVVNSGQGIVVRRSNRVNGFGPYENWTTQAFVGNVGNYFADVDGDKCADAIVVNSGQGIVVRRSNCVSGFGAYENWTTQAFVGNVGNYFADVDGDGYADAIVVNSGQGVVVRRSNGVNGFSPNENWTDNPYFGNVKTFFVDVDRPGAPGSCVGSCGTTSGSCWCDSLCAGFGDCCGDKVPICGL